MRPSFFLIKRPVCSQCATSLGIVFRRQASNQKTGPFRRAVIEDGLPKEPCRARFAPSPTGSLHLGSLRTALYNYLLAKATGGQFILRVEDTDRSRLIPGSEEKLYQDLKWAGLSWDEGPDVGGPFGPYRQSERNVHYHSHAETLVKEGKAYRCFCSPVDLERHKAEAHITGASTNYPGTCREIPLEESERRRDEAHAIRFKSGTAPVEFNDIVYNRYKKGEAEEDFVIVKRDGYPTYHFANVVDDHLMEITHVIRGAEWLISTPKHIELYQAFQWTPPKFAHLGLLVNQDGQKLSKRHGGFDMEEYKQEKILPAALLNFVALHGWRRRGLKSEVLTLEEMVKHFDLRCGKGDITVSFDKLGYLNAKHRRILVDRDPPDMALLSDLWLKPINAAVTRFNHIILHQDAKADSIRPHRFQKELGANAELVQDLQRGTPAQMDEYILQALRISSKLPEPKSNIEDWVKENEHLFWAVSVPALEKRARDLPFEEIFNGKEPCDLARAIGCFLDAADAVSARKWNTAALDGVFKPLIKNLTYRDRNTHEIVRAGGSILLRWALMGGDHGPALIPIMGLMGKEETVMRLQRALDVAESI